MAWISVPSPARRVAKQSLPVLREKMTRPAMPTRSPVAVSTGRSGNRDADVRDGRRDRQADAVGLHAPRGELLALLAPDPHLLGQVVVRIGVLLEGAGGVGRHNAQG